MKNPLRDDPLGKKLQAATLVRKRLAHSYGRGVVFALITTVGGLFGGYMAAGILGLLFIAFMVIVASTSPLQAEHILAALAEGSEMRQKENPI